MTQILRLKACLNGSRDLDEHPALPVTPEQLATVARTAVDAGAEAIHLHPRNSDGAESLRAEDVAAAVRAVREACGPVPIGVSTGLWIVGRGRVGVLEAAGVALRQLAVSAWSEIAPADRPDFASVNVSEPGFADLAAALHALDIDVEPGVWSEADAEELARVVASRPWIRVLVEIVGADEVSVGSAIVEADAILRRLDDLHVDGPRLLHGEGAACWPLVVHAASLGLPTRIGFEDTLNRPDGTRPIDNADLVIEALRVMSREAS